MGTFWNRMLFGLLLIAAGVVFLFEQAGLIEVDLSELIRTYWPVLIIYFSLQGIVVHRKWKGESGGVFWNFVGAAVGCYILGRNLGVVEANLGELIPYLVPLGLILFGLSIIFGPKRKHKHERAREEREEWKRERYEWKQQRRADKERRRAEARGWSEPDLEFPPPPPPVDPIPPIPPDDSSEQRQSNDAEGPRDSVPPHKSKAWRDSFTDPGTRNHSSFIGDLYLGHDYWELQNMNISHFIGDTVLDLTKAHIPYGETRLNISAFIGDVKMFVPHDVELDFNVTAYSFLGDKSVLDRQDGGFMKNVDWKAPGYEEAEKRIRIQVSQFIGDLRIQRVG